MSAGSSKYIMCSSCELRSLDYDRTRPVRRSPPVCRKPIIDDLAEEARELSSALDLYKLMHRRCYLTFEEIVGVLRELGYRKCV